MNSRLDELLRQRELMREHLRWLENEIVGAQGGKETSPLLGKPEDPKPTVSASDENLSPLPEPDLKSVQSEVKSGCLIYSLILFGGLAALVGFIYWKY
jgi:hypothetical protein